MLEPHPLIPGLLSPDPLQGLKCTGAVTVCILFSVSPRVLPPAGAARLLGGKKPSSCSDQTPWADGIAESWGSSCPGQGWGGGAARPAAPRSRPVLSLPGYVDVTASDAPFSAPQ